MNIFTSKRYFLFTFFLFFLFFSELRAEKKYNFSICSLFKNEAPHLKEWIEYHKLIGVDHFYLYNNDSTDNCREILTPYIKEGSVTLINWPSVSPVVASPHIPVWGISTMIPALENAAKFVARDETKWLTFLQVEEFLVPVEGNSFTALLEKHESSPGILLKSDFFDAYSIDCIPRKKLTVESVELASAPHENVHTTWERSIFKPEEVAYFVYPPYTCRFKKKQQPVLLSRTKARINRYLHRFNGTLQFARQKEKAEIDSRVLSDAEREMLLGSGYEIEDTERCIQRFIPELIHRMEETQ